MKNKLFLIFLMFFFPKISLADDLNIKAKNIKIDKINQTSIFENDVLIKDKQNLIKSDYAKYDKKKNFFILRKNIMLEDKNGHKFYGEYATYDKVNKIFVTVGKSNFTTSKGYSAETEDMVINIEKGLAFSKKNSSIEDLEGNLINLDNFEYQTNNNIFKSIGNIEIKDKTNNLYNFSQIYLDEKKKELIGTDSKAYLNPEIFSSDKRNKPRVFSNVINVRSDQIEFLRSAFTVCDYRKNDKCPPWELIAGKMRHDNKKKTIYYDNAIIKLYNIPIFYIPKIAHPDPSVKRRTGFLVPSYSDTKNLGSSLNIPFYWAMDENKDLTINNRLFASENPLFVGDYRHVFKDSNLNLNFGYTGGYKKESSTKKKGDKSHFFSKFTKTFEGINAENNLELKLQHVSNRKYLKLYKIDTNLVDYSTDTLENSFNISSYYNEKDLFLNFETSSFTSLSDNYNDKYEYLLPNISLTRGLFSKKFGYGELYSNLKVHNYDTNKTEKIFTNSLSWQLDRPFKEQSYSGALLAQIKNFNYENKNISKFKNDATSEFFGALGYLASIDLFKSLGDVEQYLKPKILLKLAPKHMKKESGDFYLHNKDIFSLDRLGSDDNIESGASMTVGFDYERSKNNKELNFSLGQIINEKKTNKKMPSSSSLDDRFSDVIGNMNYTNNSNFNLNYDFSLKQNYKEASFNKIDADFYNDYIKFNVKYLDEEKIASNTEYIASSIEIKKGNNGVFTLSNKRNLITNSSEYYNLSYEYINDCLRAGLVYRREFYDDSELEAENSLMFKITLSPFGSMSSPSFNE
tara:strand:- start:2132 stop:4531 length:2400 start_codon:yes stop_codon:yes gene_type:complete